MKYNWDKKELIKKQLLVSVAHICNNDDEYFDKLLLNYSNGLNQMINGVHNGMPRLIQYKDNFYYNKDIYELLTPYTINNLERIIKIILDNDFRYLTDLHKFNNDGDVVKKAFDFFDYIGNEEAKKEIMQAVKTKRISVRKDNKNLPFSGVCYFLLNKPYYLSTYKDYYNNLSILTHEISHGLDYIHCKEDVFKPSKNIYTEITSLLTEIYCTDYQHNIGMVNDYERAFITNDIYLTNIDDNIESIHVMLKLCNKLDDFSIASAKKISNKTCEEIKCTPLSTSEMFGSLDLLTYLYCGVIAICIYEKYKDNPKAGLEEAFNIFKNIDTDNEEELLGNYIKDMKSSIKKYTDDNNELVKKMKKNN